MAGDCRVGRIIRWKNSGSSFGVGMEFPVSHIPMSLINRWHHWYYLSEEMNTETLKEAHNVLKPYLTSLVCLLINFCGFFPKKYFFAFIRNLMISSLTFLVWIWIQYVYFTKKLMILYLHRFCLVFILLVRLVFHT